MRTEDDPCSGCSKEVTCIMIQWKGVEIWMKNRQKLSFIDIEAFNLFGIEWWKLTKIWFQCWNDEIADTINKKWKEYLTWLHHKTKETMQKNGKLQGHWSSTWRW